MSSGWSRSEAVRLKRALRRKKRSSNGSALLVSGWHRGGHGQHAAVREPPVHLSDRVVL